MQPLTLILLTFVGVLAVVLGAFWLFVVRREAIEHKALEKRLKPPVAAKKSRIVMSKAELRPEGGHALFGGMQAVIDQSGLSLNVPGLLFACWMTGFVVGLAVWVVRPGVVMPLVAGILVSSLPFLFVRFKANQRMWKFEEQFPEAVDLIARALRAGHAFPIGLMMVAEEIGSPVGPEFKLLYDRQNYGMPFPDALRAFARRIPVLDAKFFVTAVLTQREAGGNLAGVLDNLSSVIRERFKVKRQVRVISAHGRMTAGVLMGLPPFVAIAQGVVAPENAQLLFNEPLGQKILIAAGVLQVIGMLIIRKIIKVEVLMSPLLLVSLLGTFMAVALLSGAAAYAVLDRQSATRKRLQPAAPAGRSPLPMPAGPASLSDRPNPRIERIASFVPKSPGEMNRLRRRLVRAGHHSLTAAVVFSLAEIGLPVLLAAPVLVLVPWPQSLIFAALAGMLGFLMPGLVLGRMIERRREIIGNGLPDVLDLLIVCLEAGCSLDQAITKATEELALVYPALGEELRMVTTETRAGKPRIEAFKNFEARTKHDDVRALVAMLVQTDRFGTSISQALRTFSEVLRTKRRQRAEERAAKVGVKMVFPLVLFLFPALYAVTLGAAIVQIANVWPSIQQ